VTKINLKSLGEFLRRERERRNWTLDDVADDTLKRTTAWRIERGFASVGLEKYKYYCEKLGFDIEDFRPQDEDNGQIDSLKERLDIIELNIELGHDLPGYIKQLESIRLQPRHPFGQIIHFLKAKAFMYERKPDRAEREFRQAITKADRHFEKYGYLNILSCAYSGLSTIAYRRDHDIEGALHLVGKAVELFNPDGERQEAQYMILMNQAAYLEKAGRLGEAEKIINFLAKEKDKIHPLPVKIAVYQLLAQMKRQKMLLDEALNHALQGLKIACGDKVFDRAVGLWDTLGKIYEDMGRLNEARDAYVTAISLKDKLKDPLIVLDPLNHLGYLYLKQANFSLAKSIFTEALESGKNGGSRYIDSLIGISTLFFRQGVNQKAQAIDFLKEALDLAHTQKLLKKKKRIILMLTEAYEEVDDPEQYLRYLVMLQKIDIELAKGEAC
jgi:tetratricopeptide (TPR) repeat protein